MDSVSPMQRLGELGLELPQPRPAGGAYSPVVIDRGLAYVSGLIAIEDDRAVYTGILGQGLDIEDGQKSARVACLRSLGTLAQAIGGLDQVQRIIKVTGYVRADPSFTDLPKVLDGASILLIDLFGEAGRSARTTVGVAALPRGASVEVDMVVRLRDP
jgi:enamine deaminase RidA (YjgF/YER057c/UK114 family)